MNSSPNQLASVALNSGTYTLTFAANAPQIAPGITSNPAGLTYSFAPAAVTANTAGFAVGRRPDAGLHRFGRRW